MDVADQWHLTLAFVAHVPDRSLRRPGGPPGGDRGTASGLHRAGRGWGRVPAPRPREVLWAGLEGTFDALSRARATRPQHVGCRRRRPAVPAAPHPRAAGATGQRRPVGAVSSTRTPDPPGPWTRSPSWRRTSVRPAAAASRGRRDPPAGATGGLGRDGQRGGHVDHLGPQSGRERARPHLGARADRPPPLGGEAAYGLLRGLRLLEHGAVAGPAAAVGAQPAGGSVRPGPPRQPRPAGPRASRRHSCAHV